jgi:uncharacterized membrane protein YphA (DoxX/SURF4 family)
MKRLWSGWVALLSREESGECLAVMRILVAITVFIMIGVPIANDLVGVLYYPPEYGGYLQVGESTWIVDALGGPTPQLVWSLLITTAVAALALAFGVQARVAALVAGQCLLALRGINSSQGSYSTLVSNALWLCVLSRCDVTLSLTCRLRTGSWTCADRVPAWPRLLGVAQLVIIYTWTGLSKISAFWIGDFSAIYFILQDPNWQRFDMSRAAYVYPLTQVSTAIIWLWETSFGVILLAAYFKETADRPGRLRGFFNRHNIRAGYMFIGLGAHLGIAATMVVGPFLLATLAFYPCLFPPSEWRAGWRWARGLNQCRSL